MLTIPGPSLIVLIGPSGSGKTTFARTHFKPTEILSSDFCRGLVADEESDMSATQDAFEVLHAVAAKRLARGRLTVIDATNVQPESRRPLMELSRRYQVLAVAVVLDLPEMLCQERNRLRPDRACAAHIIRQQRRYLERSVQYLRSEGFWCVNVLRSPEDVAAVTIMRQPLRHADGENRGVAPLP